MAYQYVYQFKRNNRKKTKRDSPVQYKKYPLETIDVAVDVTRSLLECALIWRSKLTFFSSSEIYGDPSPEFVPTPESFRGNVACQGPRACYDESKRLGETLCYVFASNYNLHTNIIRPFNVYGPGMSKHDYRLIPNLMRAAKENQTIKVSILLNKYMPGLHIQKKLKNLKIMIIIQN